MNEQPVQRHVASQRYTRRLSDKILITCHQACDQGDIEVARCLLDVLAYIVHRPPAGLEGQERRIKESLVAAYERLWQLLHPEAWEC
jgi:hypothetical protein